MHGQSVRELLRRATSASLATLDSDSGHPFVSLVEVATLVDARPIFLLSGLARHTRNLVADARASLLIDARVSNGGSLATSRVTIVGSMTPTADREASHRYLARYPDAGAIAALGDFLFWRLDIDHAHAIAGFGRIGRVAAADIMLTGEAAAELARQETELITRVNARLAGHELGRRLVGIDPEGLDLRSPDLARLDCPGLAMNEESIVKTISSASA